MTITRNDFALFLAMLSGAWVGSARFEHGGVAVLYWIFGVATLVASLLVMREPT